MHYELDYKIKTTNNNDWSILLKYGIPRTFNCLNDTYKYLASGCNLTDYDWKVMEIEAGIRRSA